MANLNMVLNGQVLTCSGDNECVKEMQDKFIVAAQNVHTSIIQEDKPGDAACPICGVNVTTTKRIINGSIDAIMQSIEDGSLILNIGDVIPCVLSDGQRVHFEVTAIDDEGYRLEMKELLKCMAHTDLQKWYSEFYHSMLPASLRDAVISTKRKYKDYENDELVEFISLIFAPSASEVFSKEEFDDNSWLGDKGVYEQLDFYKDWRNRIRCTVEDGKPNAWWLLSAGAGSSTYFAYVLYGGYCDYSSATNTWIAAPVCFRIRRKSN